MAHSLAQRVALVARMLAALGAFSASSGAVAATESSSSRTGWLGNRGMRFSPSASLQWHAVDGDKSLSRRVRAGWLGLRAETDLALARWPVTELGGHASLFRSAWALTPDARGASATEMEASAYFLLKANTTVFGIPALRLGAGYFSSSRSGGPANEGFIPRIAGPRFSAEASTRVDGIFSVALLGGYTFSSAGVLDLGGYLKHRVISAGDRAWDARIGVSASGARAQGAAGSLLRETWSSLQVGISGEI